LQGKRKWFSSQTSLTESSGRAMSFRRARFGNQKKDWLVFSVFLPEFILAKVEAEILGFKVI
jgi:hypothetical protein